MAYALRYTEHWKEWVFLEVPEFDSFSNPVGTCIEGIKVDFKTPGFDGITIYSIVNSTGKDAPKTNVARSNIETTPESENLSSTIYQLYLDHIAAELQNLKKGFSITWAANEANYQLSNFTNISRGYNKPNVRLQNIKAFRDALNKLENILIEKHKKRILINLSDLNNLKHFWTIDSASYSSANSLIKEVKSSDSSAIALLDTIFNLEDSQNSHIDYLLCNLKSNSITESMIRNKFQVDTIEIISEQRRLDLRWSYTDEKKWEEIILSEEKTNTDKCYLQLKDINFKNITNEIAIISGGSTYILNNSKIHEFLSKLIYTLSPTKEDKMIINEVTLLIISLFRYKNFNKIEDLIDSRLERQNNRGVGKLIWEKVDKQDLINAILKTNFIIYDTTVWSRRGLHMF